MQTGYKLFVKQKKEDSELFIFIAFMSRNKFFVIIFPILSNICVWTMMFKGRSRRYGRMNIKSGAVGQFVSLALLTLSYLLLFSLILFIFVPRYFKIHTCAWTSLQKKRTLTKFYSQNILEYGSDFGALFNINRYRCQAISVIIRASNHCSQKGHL